MSKEGLQRAQQNDRIVDPTNDRHHVWNQIHRGNQVDRAHECHPAHCDGILGVPPGFNKASPSAHMLMDAVSPPGVSRDGTFRETLPVEGT